MRSMTGFGRAKKEENNRIYTIEIKSVNHKYTDISVRVPRYLSYLEEKIKKEVQKNIYRGKIDIFVTFENYSDEAKEIIINKELTKKYIEELKKVAQENNLSYDIPITEITKLPEVLNIKNSDENEDIIEKELLECLKEAIQNFILMKENEGNKIKEDLERRINKVENKILKISEYSTGLVANYVVKLEERIKEILKTDIIDETRLATEVVIYADKCSVEEELTRLKSHVNQFRQMLEEKENIGKKMDFLIQEMNRETNTIGSKSNLLEITNSVIEIKVELEDIREQVQNIE